MCSRGWSYIVKAGTIILLCNTLVQLMQSFDWSFQVVAEGMEETSILATIAKPVAYLLVPVVGYHAWQLAAAAVTGFIAKENVVATLAVCYAFTVNEDLELVSSGEAAAAMVGMTKAASLAYMMFNLYSPPCFAAIGAMNAEMRDKKWLLGGIALQLGVGFTVGYLVYTVGTLLMEPQALNISGAVAGAAAIAAFAAVVCFLIARNRTMARQAAERK
jgi:ferrous iron transport protein B